MKYLVFVTILCFGRSALVTVLSPSSQSNDYTRDYASITAVATPSGVGTGCSVGRVEHQRGGVRGAVVTGEKNNKVEERHSRFVRSSA